MIGIEISDNRMLITGLKRVTDEIIEGAKDGVEVGAGMNATAAPLDRADTSTSSSGAWRKCRGATKIQPRRLGAVL